MPSKRTFNMDMYLKNMFRMKKRAECIFYPLHTHILHIDSSLFEISKDRKFTLFEFCQYMYCRP